MAVGYGHFIATRATQPFRILPALVKDMAPRLSRSISRERAALYPKPSASPERYDFDLPERPLGSSRRASNEEGQKQREQYRRRTSRSRSPRGSRSRSHSRSRSYRERSEDFDDRQHISLDAFERPTALHYRPSLILRGHKKAVSAVQFSPDGKKIASCSADGTVKIWNAESGKLEHTLEGHLAGISTLAWSPDSKLIASGSDDKTIRLWDAETGKPHPIPFTGHHNYIYSVAFSPKGNMLVSGSYDEAVYLWDVRAARVMRTLPAHSDPVSGVDFVRDGTLIVSCSSDGLIRIWDTATGQCLRTLIHEDNAPVVGVRFSPNGKYVLAWTLDSCIRLWNYVEGRCIKTYTGHANTKFSLGGAFGMYGPQEYPFAFVVSGSEDGEVWFWDVKTKTVLQRLEGHQGVVLGVDTHPNAPIIASGGADRTVRVWKCDEVHVKTEESQG